MRKRIKYYSRLMLALLTLTCYQSFGQGFSPSPVSWSTPTNLDQISDFSTGFKHTIMDINGDGKPDLVVTYNNGYIGSVGNFRWDVYLNNGSGFNSSPVSWSTPTNLDQISDFSTGFKHTTMDINGDGKPDLVVTYNNGYIGSDGNFRWDVYLNNGSGFNSSPVSWSTPTNLDQISDFSTGFKHTTMDIDGDSKPDLVVTYNNGYIGSVGNFRWDVYLNNGAGFNSSPVSWSTPSYFDQITDFSTGLKYTTMDIDGDGKPDLVVTYNNGYIGSVGNFRWDVYLNNGSGFNGSPVSWSTPSNFDQITDFSTGLKYTTMDIDGDDKPDLVVTYNNGYIGSVGNFRWDVYLNNGSGFNSSPVSWSTPSYFDQISDFSTSLKYTTMDIDGNGKPDLVVTYDNGYIGSVGNFRWDVYLNLSTVSVEELNNSSLTLKTFPNPTNDVFYIDLSEVPLHSVTIYNNFGQILHQERGLKSNNFSFDLSSYSSGLYYLKVESDGNVSTIKIIRK